ncbi:hypothetical protein DFZ90_20495 [Escherichia coli]|nr:hypothetical protein [Escherichia coli]EFO1915666.1 hypothetical protein [Escherichia coli]RRM24190.1 hypothetical protein DU303_15250 [Escherichia coli]
MTDFGGKTSIFSHPVYLFLRKFSLQDSRGGSISCCSGLNTSMPLQLPLKPFLTIFMSSIRNLHHA